MKNAVPPGEIETNGNFGPWSTENPGATALQGAFTFARADLSVFKGISGILAAHGTFGGVLERLIVDGETTTPDFAISVGGHPFPLNTKYQAIVDGTNGDTYLERIDASFLNSSLVAKGAVMDAPKGVHGRTVSLDIDMQKGRIEDIMRMAVPTPKPPMTGGAQGRDEVPAAARRFRRVAATAARWRFLDPGRAVHQLRRAGENHLAQPSQSRAGTGHAEAERGVGFHGPLQARGGRLALPDLMFGVPGARVELAGTTH